MRIRKLLTITVTLAALGYGGAVLMKHSVSEASIPKSDAKPVAVAIVARENLNRNIDLTAEFRPYQEIDLRAKVAGYLSFIKVDIGDQVKQGQVIAKIDTDELKSDLARAAAEYQNAKLVYDRVAGVEKLHPHMLAQAEVDKAQAAYDMAKANMAHARTFMDYATISVPFDGVVTKRYADPGALIQAGVSSSTGAQPIVHIAENDRLRLDFPVPESVAAQVNRGTPVDVTVQATGQKISGKISRISDMVDNSTRTMQAEVDIDNSDLRLKPGMYAHVNVILESKNAVLTLPVQAVAAGEKPTVWRVDNGKMEEVPVALGLQTPEKAEILGGVNEGDQVIFGSRNALSLDMNVEPKPIAAKKG